MTYPEHVVDRVAAAFWNTEMGENVRDWDFEYLKAKAAEGYGDYGVILADVRAGAVAALEALGFREVRTSGVIGSWTRWVAMTDWEWE